MKLFLWFSPKSVITVRGFSAEKWCVSVIFPRHMWYVGGWVYERPQSFTSSLIHTLCHVKLFPTRDTMHFPATWFDLSHRTWKGSLILTLSLIYYLLPLTERAQRDGSQPNQQTPRHEHESPRWSPVSPTCIIIVCYCQGFVADS